MEKEQRSDEASEGSVHVERGVRRIARCEMLAMAEKTGLVCVLSFSGEVVSPYIEGTDIEVYLTAFVESLGIGVDA